MLGLACYWVSRTPGRCAEQQERHSRKQRGKRACAMTARGSISKAIKGLVGGAAQGSSDCRRNRTTQPSSLGDRALALIPPVRSVPRQHELPGPAENSKIGTERDEETRTKQNRHRFIAPRQEHLDAVVSVAGTGQRRRLLRSLDIITIKWAMGDIPEQCHFLLNTQLMFWKKGKDPSSKQFDDDEWRTASHTTSMTCIQMGQFLRKYVSRRLQGAQ